MYILERNPKLYTFLVFPLPSKSVFFVSFVTKFATQNSLRTINTIMAMNGTAAPTARLTANALALLMEEKPDSATFQPVLQIAGALLFCRE